MVILDTNAILRYILQDNEIMANEVDNLIETNICHIPIEVIAEMVYVLSKVYKIDRGKISDTIIGVIQHKNIDTSTDLLTKAAEIFNQTKLDFVDCMLVAYSKVKNLNVFTFDKDLKKLL